MNSTERKIFRKLLKKRWTACARAVCLWQLATHRQVSEEQFDQYLTLLGPEKVSARLRQKTARQQRKLTSFDQRQTREPVRKLKVAVLLSGQPTGLEHCIHSIRRFFHGHEVHYFCHTWDNLSAAARLEDLGDEVYRMSAPQPDFTEYERRAIETYGMKTFSNGIRVPFVSPNIFPMWFAVQQVFGLIEKSGKSASGYDLICRMRYDDFWIGQFDCEDLPLSDEQIIIDRNYNGYGGYGDQFAIGNPAAMGRYCNLYSWLTDGFLDNRITGQLFPEVLLRHFLEQSGISVREENFGLRLLRPEFAGMQPYDIPLRCHQASSQRNRRVSAYIKQKFPELYNDNLSI